MDAIEAAVFDALTTAAIGIPIYQHVPQDTPPPVIIIADMDADDSIATKGDDDDEQITLQILTTMQAEERKPVLVAQSKIKKALHEKMLLQPGWEIRPLWQSHDAVLLPDGETYLGTSLFTVMALTA